MREFLLFIASLAGAAVMTALAVLIRPDSPFWKWFLWLGVLVFIGCALALLIDLLRPGDQTPKHPLDEKLPGFGSGMMVRIDDSPDVRRKYQYEFRTPDGAKAAFYLSASNRFAFSVTDIHGEPNTLDIPLGSNGVPIGKWVYVFCEVGTASNYSYLRALVNGKEVARRDNEFPIDMGSRRWMPVLGSDASGQNGGVFSLLEIIAYGTTQSDADLLTIANNALRNAGIVP
jgi:hypothetical protein